MDKGYTKGGKSKSTGQGVAQIGSCKGGKKK